MFAKLVTPGLPMGLGCGDCNSDGGTPGGSCESSGGTPGGDCNSEGGTPSIVTF